MRGPRIVVVDGNAGSDRVVDVIAPAGMLNRHTSTPFRYTAHRKSMHVHTDTN
jgi:hypothetical protein